MRNTVELVPLTYADMNISKPQQQKKHAHHHIYLGYSESPCPRLGRLIVVVV